MANLKLTKYAYDYFWDIFSKDSDVTASVSANKKTVTLVFDDVAAGGTTTLVIEGSSLKINAKNELSGSVSTIKAYNAAGENLLAITGIGSKVAGLDLDARGQLQQALFANDDTLTGSRHSDDLAGWAGNDRLSGGAGDDYFSDFTGKDTYIGGSGYDFVDFSAGYFQSTLKGKGVTVDLGKGTATDPWGYKDKLVGIEEIRGTNFADKLSGSNKAVEEYFEGLRGADVIDGRGGEDMVSYARDARYGGAAGVTVDLGKGTGKDGFGTVDTLIGIENVRGSVKNDVLIGSTGFNFLRGDSGNDTLKGMGGGDSLEGNGGNDTLFGTVGFEDRFIFRNRDDLSLGKDVLKSFSDGEDLIRFRDFDDITSVSDLTFEQSGTKVLIHFSHGDIVVENMTVDKLTADDFTFV